ncbi:winged helix-turn-helix domain-containing protein [Paenibacillus sp. P96]|uniref:Winged helix-turn-helix domain-containing protein n=1 Tax=Paenibacillus zeirhizosphaerae TaxID=2987519 RepID=A0ABT9FNZ3_9BACL|nr:winged helix-turn-helix domain-containing protein [Paenibacillus sp. P96]MDP4096221.1 winged helix-turn-helix domain-containing protein [Paenibacillus sp. P96]
MNELKFETDGCKVTYGTESVTLLAKEFALLRFLYDHCNQIFTREQLLDHVWPMEYPVERTVDDHVYRLRKKLRRWSGLSIHTVRGLGYKLIRVPVGERLLPSLNDSRMQEAVHILLQRYHLLGQGTSLQTLAAQEEQLGFELTPLYRMYAHFVKADIGWFLEEKELPAGVLLYWCLILYWATGPVTPYTVQQCERALATGVLPSSHARELRHLNILEAYIENDEPGRAARLLPRTHEIVKRDRLDGFILPVAITEVYLHLSAGQLVKVHEQLGRIEAMLEEMPYLRERGRYTIFKGLWHLREGHAVEAEKLVDEGIRILDAAGQELMKIKAVCQIVRYLELHCPHERLENKYKRVYGGLDRDNKLSILRPQLASWLEHTLATV